jgi:predicted enzyme related to lactoylglutathione lyase
MIRFAHVNVVARDWRALAKFYVDVFGCVARLPERDLGGAWLDDITAFEGAHIRGVHLALPGHGDAGPTLEVFGYERPKGRAGSRALNRPGFAHIAFAVDDVRKTLTEMERRGGERVGRVARTVIPGAGTLEVVYARDPEGNIVELQRWS